jgi:hypothetical protein
MGQNTISINYYRIIGLPDCNRKNCRTVYSRVSKLLLQKWNKCQDFTRSRGATITTNMANLRVKKPPTTVIVRFQTGLEISNLLHLGVVKLQSRPNNSWFNANECYKTAVWLTCEAPGEVWPDSHTIEPSWRNPRWPIRPATRGVDPELFVPDQDPAFQKISGPDLTLTVKIYF